MSSSSATATASRSPSPATPDSSDAGSSRRTTTVAIHNHNDKFDLSWYYPGPGSLPPSGAGTWDYPPAAADGQKDQDQLLLLPFDDLIEEHAYDDSSPYSSFDPSPIFPASPISFPTTTHSQSKSPVLQTQTPTHSMHPPPTSDPSPDSNANAPLVVVHSQGTTTKPIPPPPASSRPRKRESFAAFQRVVFPPKESCYNLPIIVPNIPPTGTKSRVETQVRVTVDLVHAGSSSPLSSGGVGGAGPGAVGEPFKYDRVGSWKWLKLPAGTATKKRTRKEGKIDPIAEDMLYLTATISCASPPHNPVVSCTSCQAREAKRVARKLAARVRPARSDSDSPSPHNNNNISLPLSHTTTTPKKLEDTTSIIQFNCPEILDFTSGSVTLPLRITCYCRHHREKVGFCVRFRMVDCMGRCVGEGGVGGPIMITDDHKSVGVGRGAGVGVGGTGGGGEEDVQQQQQFGQRVESSLGVLRVDRGDAKAPSKRKHPKESGGQQTKKKRTKPYDAIGRSNGGSGRVSRESSVVSLGSFGTANGNNSSNNVDTNMNANAGTGATSPSTRSSTPSLYFGSGQMQDPASSSASSMSGGVGALDAGSGVSPADTIHLPQSDQQQVPPFVSAPNAQHPSNPLSLLQPHQPHPLPYLFFSPTSPPPLSSLPLSLPKIHRLVPSTGPTYGGIEVTILGANFHPSLTLNCVFGGTVASSTQRWSDNTLVCVLPPRAVAGVVAVWFDGVRKDEEDPAGASCLFTYTDESDRALMELALQVVGLKMTGKIEDAKNVAMRIVGTSGADEPAEGAGDTSDMMQLSSYRDIRPLLLTRTRAGDGASFESVIIDFLSILDVDLAEQSTTTTTTPPISSAISHTTPSGQTLLHLAALLGFPALVQFLINHDVDLDARDRNGYTALHFTAVGGSKECARLIVGAGADLEIVNVLGKTPREQAPFGFFEDVDDDDRGDGEEEDGDDDDESRWGDGEEDEEDEAIVVSRRSLGRTTTTTIRRRAETPVNPQEDSPVDSSPYPMDEKKHTGPDTVDEKQTASFVDMIQRTLAQLYATQGIIPKNMPQLPLPHLPEMPAVPWGALPHIPVVFPVFVPMPGWPSLRGEKRESGQQDAAIADTDKDDDGDGRTPTGSGGAIRAAQEWRATCEKWMALAMATATMRQEEAPPPMYTPRTSPDVQPPPPTSTSPQSEPDDEGESSSATARPQAPAERPVARRFGYASVPITDQDVNAYAYRPAKSQSQKMQKKGDRMLVYFWIPILLLSLIWALYTGTRYAIHALRNVLPGQTAIRG